MLTRKLFLPLTVLCTLAVPTMSLPKPISRLETEPLASREDIEASLAKRDSDPGDEDPKPPIMGDGSRGMPEIVLYGTSSD
jgi:hypothetical protein